MSQTASTKRSRAVRNRNALARSIAVRTSVISAILTVKINEQSALTNLTDMFLTFVGTASLAHFSETCFARIFVWRNRRILATRTEMNNAVFLFNADHRSEATRRDTSMILTSEILLLDINLAYIASAWTCRAFISVVKILTPFAYLTGFAASCKGVTRTTLMTLAESCISIWFFRALSGFLHMEALRIITLFFVLSTVEQTLLSLISTWDSTNRNTATTLKILGNLSETVSLTQRSF